MNKWLKDLFIRSSSCGKCLEIVEFMLDGESDPEQELFLIEHLEGCEPCFEYYHLELNARKIMREEVKNWPVPEGLINSIKTKVREIA